MIPLTCEQRANQFLDVHLPSAQPPSFHRRRLAIERRAKARSCEVVQARVWGVDVHNEAFSFDCEIENISSAGMYLTVPCQIKFSSEISLVVRLLHSPDGIVTAGIRGKVIRDEPQPDGSHGIAVMTSEYEFL
jgi:PilZ domain-containing protein